MGNKGSYEGPFADVELAVPGPSVVAIDARFARSQITRIRLAETSSFSKNLVFKNLETSKKEFFTGPDKELGMFLDADKKPLVKVATKPNINNIYYVHRPGSAAPSDNELLQIYVKLGEQTKTGYLDSVVRVDFTDASTGERCKIEMEGEWRARTALLWLERGHSSPRTPVGRIYRHGMRNGFNLDIAPNIDVALVLLICAVVDDDLKRSRLRANKQGDGFAPITNPYMS